MLLHCGLFCTCGLYLSQVFEDKTQLTAALTENNELKATNTKLAETCDLRKYLKSNDPRITNIEQYYLNTNIEVKGIPKQANETLESIQRKLGEEIGEPRTKADIEMCHRVPVPNSASKIIIVQFTRRLKRNDVLEKARKHRLTTRDLGFSAMILVYLNEHLCPRIKKLLSQATARKKEAGWKFVSVRNGQIFSRKTEDGPVAKITCREDLSKPTTS